MSHKATNWAIQQRGISPAAKLVLWHLCDRHNPDQGCFPSQALLADDCEMSRSGLNLQLTALEEAGLIKRHSRRDEATNRQQVTRYKFAFEADFLADDGGEPCPKIGHGAVSNNPAKPCPIIGESRVHMIGHAIEPVSEPVIEPERERAREEILSFEQARRAWPSGFADSRDDALSAWLGLSLDDRKEATDEIERFVNTSKSVGRKLICGFAAYLREQRWKALPERLKPAARAIGAPSSSAPPKPRTPTKAQLANPHLYPEVFGSGVEQGASQ